MLQSKDTEWLNRYKNKSHLYATYKRLTLELETRRLKLRRWEKILLPNAKEKKTGIATHTRKKQTLKQRLGGNTCIPVADSF